MKLTILTILFLLPFINSAQQSLVLWDAEANIPIRFAAILDVDKNLSYSNENGKLNQDNLKYPIKIRASLYKDTFVIQKVDTIYMESSIQLIDEVKAKPINLEARYEAYIDFNRAHFRTLSDTIAGTLTRFMSFRNLDNTNDETFLKQETQLNCELIQKGKSQWYCQPMSTIISKTKQAVFDTSQIVMNVQSIPSAKELFEMACLNSKEVGIEKGSKLNYHNEGKEVFEIVRPYELKNSGYLYRTTATFMDSNILQLKIQIGLKEIKPGVKPIVRLLEWEFNYDLHDGQSSVSSIIYSEKQLFSSKENGGIVPYNLEIIKYEIISLMESMETEIKGNTMKEEEYKVAELHSGFINFLFR